MMFVHMNWASDRGSTNYFFNWVLNDVARVIVVRIERIDRSLNGMVM